MPRRVKLAKLRARKTSTLIGTFRWTSILTVINPSIKKLEDVDVQKLNNLYQWNRETAETVKWLRQNKDKFKMEVFEPPCLSVSVTNRQYAAAVEAVVGGNSTVCTMI